jgi:hypothetical protein
MRARIAGAKALFISMRFSGPAEAVPLLQDRIGGICQQPVKSCSFKANEVRSVLSYN